MRILRLILPFVLSAAVLAQAGETWVEYAPKGEARGKHVVFVSGDEEYRTDLSETVDSFFNDREYFTSIEFGWTTAQDQIYLDNAHLTIWRVAEREAAGTPGGWGFNVSWNTWLNERWMPFVRAGYADDGGSLLEVAVSAGAGRRTRHGNVLGFAGHWGRPNADTYGEDLDDQYVGEIYFRWRIGDYVEITPNVQLLVNPALNPEHDTIWVGGLRVKGAI